MSSTWPRVQPRIGLLSNIMLNVFCQVLEATAGLPSIKVNLVLLYYFSFSYANWKGIQFVPSALLYCVQQMQEDIRRALLCLCVWILKERSIFHCTIDKWLSNLDKKKKSIRALWMFCVDVEGKRFPCLNARTQKERLKSVLHLGTDCKSSLW